MASTTTATCCDTATSKQTKARARASHVTHDITATHGGQRRGRVGRASSARDPFYIAGPRPHLSRYVFTRTASRSNECLDRFVRDTNNLYTPFAVPFRLLHCRFHPSLIQSRRSPAPRPSGPLHPRTTLAEELLCLGMARQNQQLARRCTVRPTHSFPIRPSQSAS